MTDPGSNPGVLCVGRLYCDLIFSGLPRMPSAGTEIFADGLSLHAGGGAFITSAYFSALGHRAYLSAVLPQDPFGAIARADIAKAGVDARFCVAPEPGREPQITVAILNAGDRAFVTRKTGPAISGIGKIDLAGLGIGHLHIGELTTLSENPGLIDFARDNRLTISLDCGWNDAVTGDVADLISAVDVFLPNEAEANHLLALGITEPLAPLTVVKCGASGAKTRQRKTWLHSPAISGSVVDTTGAGDAFNSGFLSQWLENAPIEDCLRLGNRCGAVAIGFSGGFCGAHDFSKAIKVFE